MKVAKKKNPKRDAQWAEAKRRCRLNVETLRMAKELGLNPRNLIKNIPSPSQPWKAPVHEWIRDLYAKRERKAAAKRARKGEKKPETAAAAPAANGRPLPLDPTPNEPWAEEPFPVDRPLDEAPDDEQEDGVPF